MDFRMDENIYGHAKRLDWLAARLDGTDRILEFGCGTGVMITRPLLAAGYDAYGVDMDRESIVYGRSILDDDGLDPNRLLDARLEDVPFTPDVVIASEVLEHIPDREMGLVMGALSAKIRSGGRLLVTVPNGYGWFEMESFLWFGMGLGRLMEASRIAGVVERLKRRLCGERGAELPSTLADSPHVQRFTQKSVRRLLESHGFGVRSVEGTVLFAGPFSNLFFTGCDFAMRINNGLGHLLPALAAGFMLDCRKDGDPTGHEVECRPRSAGSRGPAASCGSQVE